MEMEMETPSLKERKTIKILDIDFHNGSVEDVTSILKNEGGLLVVPAAPALVTIGHDDVYYDALKSADVVIADSGYMALIWNLTNRKKVNRISGLKFLVNFLEDSEVKASDKIMLVDPRPREAESNKKYLRENGFNIADDMSYLAPMYDKNKVEDPELLAQIEEKKPDYVVVNLGGGTQEKLGAYLIKNLSYKPAIICTGAAIAFLTGQQARIPKWADELYLGWLYRIFENPKQFIPRYRNSFKLVKIMLTKPAGVVS